MSGVGVGVTVGNAACTMAATVASILIVGAGVVVGTGACVAQARARTKPRICFFGGSLPRALGAEKCAKTKKRTQKEGFKKLKQKKAFLS